MIFGFFNVIFRSYQSHFDRFQDTLHRLSKTRYQVPLFRCIFCKFYSGKWALPQIPLYRRSKLSNEQALPYRGIFQFSLSRCNFCRFYSGKWALPQIPLYWRCCINYITDAVQLYYTPFSLHTGTVETYLINAPESASIRS